ncbi:hypothetical protein E4T49_06640 [Aureobasidium sp. EXF-10728]|nr:hypothetical protein E4T49_06640 [Aureobasidium sp. EXF-10728]
MGSLALLTLRRHLSFLEATKTNLQPSTTEPALIQPPKEVITKPIVTEEEPSPVQVTTVEPEEDAMNAQKEVELLAMQHVFGLKDASEESLKVKPKDLERLQRLKAAEPVFVCVDLEAFEFAQEKITEVGVSVLDSRHVIGTDPGPDGMEWLSKINTRHIIIQEHKRLVNKRFLHGCPDKFNFGQSEFVSLKHVHKTLTQMFENPSPASIRPSDQGSRNLILVGHGLSNDTAYLNKLGFAPHAKGNIIQDVDTQKFVGTKKQTVGLSKLLTGLGVEPENLHNAGNDAAYTMQALLLMTVQHTNNPGAYIKAVANAKAKIDPAKQRYKEHRAAVRERKIAEEKRRIAEEKARAASPQSASFGKHAVETASALYPKPHNLNAAGTGSVRNANSTELQRRSQPSAAPEEQIRLDQDLNLPLDQSIWLEAPYIKRLKEGSDALKSLQKPREGQSSFKRLSLDKDIEPPTHSSTATIDKPDHVSISRKRKSSDIEPVDDDFSISPAFYLAGPSSNRTQVSDDDKEAESVTDTQHEDQGDKTLAQQHTTSAAGPEQPKLGSSKHTDTRDETQAPRFGKKKANESRPSPASEQSNHGFLKKVTVLKNQIPPRMLGAAVSVEAGRQRDANKKARSREVQDILNGKQRARVQMAESQKTGPETESPPSITEENNPVLRKWLDGG